jgi:hypothetical protein
VNRATNRRVSELTRWLDVHASTLLFLATTNFLLHPFLSTNPPLIVSHRALNLDVISNHNWVLIESTTPEQEEAGDAERADSKGSSMYPEK